MTSAVGVVTGHPKPLGLEDPVPQLLVCCRPAPALRELLWQKSAAGLPGGGGARAAWCGGVNEASTPFPHPWRLQLRPRFRVSPGGCIRPR